MLGDCTSAPVSEFVPRSDFAVGGFFVTCCDAAMDGRFEAEGVRREYPHLAPVP